MRLLNTKTLQLREFTGELPGWTRRDSVQIPQYAILSHCWRECEVLFHDIQDIEGARGISGFPKIENCCKQAFKIGYKWAWVDTCCIDKSSSAELSEAINSMFKWYGHSGTCLAFLDDVDNGDPHRPDSSFRKSRWFTRGWTLQELLAPKRLAFFSNSWSFLGTKGSLINLLSDITKIPIDALSHDSLFDSFSIAQRMSWAANRRTTRIEDQAYSLMGLFNIYMPVIYGEGSSAFRRLQLEIIQCSSDQTIFAWTLKSSTPYPLPLHPNWIKTDTGDFKLPSVVDHFCPENAHIVIPRPSPFELLDSGSKPSSTASPRNEPTEQPLEEQPAPTLIFELPRHFQLEYSSILAPSPADFHNSGNIVPLPALERNKSSDETPHPIAEYSWTHLGLHIRMPLIPVRIFWKKGRPFIGMLSCWDPQQQSIYGIMLQRNDEQDPYRPYNLGIFGSGISDSSNHLVAVPKKDYDDVIPKLAVSRDIYITNLPDPSDRHAGSDSVIGYDFPARPSCESWCTQLLIVFPDFTFRRLEEMGFYLAGHASRCTPESPHDLEVRRGDAGDLLEFQLPPLRKDIPEKHVNCPSTYANLLFLNNATNQAFSVFIGYSRRGLVWARYPRVSIDVAFHRPEEFSTLGVQVLCDGYDHHDYHGHFRLPSHVWAYDEDVEGSWTQFKRDDTDDRPDLVRHCECKCDPFKHSTEATITTNFGDRRRGLSSVTSAWKEYDAREERVYCTVWVGLSVLGRMYRSGENSDDEFDARSDVAEWGSAQSDGETEDEDSLPLSELF